MNIQVSAKFYDFFFIIIIFHILASQFLFGCFLVEKKESLYSN